MDLLYDLQKFFRGYNDNLRVAMNPVFYQSVIEDYRKAKTKSIRLIRYVMPDDIEDLYERQNLQSQEAYLEVSLKARRNRSLSLYDGDILAYLRNYVTEKPVPLNTLIEIPQMPNYDTIKVDLEINGSTKVLNLKDPFASAPLYDITNDVQTENGHPVYLSINSIAQEFWKRLNLIGRLNSMSRLNPYFIVKDHLVTLSYPKKNRDNESDSTPDYKIWDFIVFYGLPLAIAVFSVIRFQEISSALTNILISTFSIFVGLLLNLLVIIYDLVKKSIQDNNELKRKFLREIFSNVSYSILVSLLLVCTLLASLINIQQLQYALSFIAYFLICNFFLTVLLILNRIHILLSKEFEPKKVAQKIN